MTTLAQVTTAEQALVTALQGLLNTYIDGATVNKGNAQFMIGLLNNYINVVTSLNSDMLTRAAAMGAV